MSLPIPLAGRIWAWACFDAWAQWLCGGSSAGETRLQIAASASQPRPVRDARGRFVKRRA